MPGEASRKENNYGNLPAVSGWASEDKNWKIR